MKWFLREGRHGMDEVYNSKAEQFEKHFHVIGWKRPPQESVKIEYQRVAE
jgi:hypothetical protein